MRAFRLCVCILLVAILSVGATGCRRAPSTSDYTLYTYDTTQGKFVGLGIQLTFREDMQRFELTMLNAVRLFGPVKETATGYLLEIDGEVYKQATTAIEELSDRQEDNLSSEALDSWNASLSVSEQIFKQGEYIFSSNTVDLIRRVSEHDNRANYTSIEGYYESAQNVENIYQFKDFKVYGNVKDKDGNATYDADGNPVMSEVPNATYLLTGGFIILTRIDAHGEVLTDDNGAPKRIVYLLSSIGFPKDITQFAYADDDYSDLTKEMAAQLAGKSVGVLTKTFYSTRDVSSLQFG